jgi:Arc/MetJ-type ribon-helix-helix transcriptional regulator
MSETMSKDTNVPIRTTQYNAIQKFIDDHPEQGYHSVAECVRDAVRKWLHKKKLEETHFTVESKNEIELR